MCTVTGNTFLQLFRFIFHLCHNTVKFDDFKIYCNKKKVIYYHDLFHRLHFEIANCKSISFWRKDSRNLSIKQSGNVKARMFHFLINFINNAISKIMKYAMQDSDESCKIWNASRHAFICSLCGSSTVLKMHISLLLRPKDIGPSNLHPSWLYQSRRNMKNAN